MCVIGTFESNRKSQGTFPALLLPCASDAIDHWRAFGSESDLHHLGEDKTRQGMGDGGWESRPKEKSIGDVDW